MHNAQGVAEANYFSHTIVVSFHDDYDHHDSRDGGDAPLMYLGMPTYRMSPQSCIHMRP